ncbi:MAG: hypothetical protein FWG12_02080 [Holophagaceae bacterium]|nr:hypothetical protein [Holophagaceae bacterium]
MKDFIAYANFMDFWALFMPETPYGREKHKKMELLFDVDSLEKIFGQISALLLFLKKLEGEPSTLAHISHYLKHIPRFNEHGQGIYDETDLFQIKKFLHNYHGLFEQLPENIRAVFGFEYSSHTLEDKLNLGQQSAETFFIADGYSEELEKTRAEILAIDAQIAELEEKRRAEIRDKYGLNFDGRAFLLVAKDSLKVLATASLLLEIDPYDDALFCVRPIKCTSSLALAEKRQELALRERLNEGAVLELLSKLVEAELPKLIRYKDAVLAFDTAWVRARMAMEHGLVRPQIHNNNFVCVEKGIYFPCRAVCADNGTAYTPLDATFEAGSTVIFGSNMGGKTVVLQTVAFLQLAAQAGLFVPAEKFETCVFNNFHYIGERPVGQISGLSGFAIEMRQLMEAWQSIKSDVDRTLLLMDEFARTTSSVEAEALLGAVLEAISEKTNTIALCSTHFHGLPRLPLVRFLKMSGLAKDSEIQATSQGNLSEIARHMTYKLVPDDGSGGSSAIAVAKMLGVDDELMKRAEKFIGTTIKSL